MSSILCAVNFGDYVRDELSVRRDLWIAHKFESKVVLGSNPARLLLRTNTYRNGEQQAKEETWNADSVVLSYQVYAASCLASCSGVFLFILLPPAADATGGGRCGIEDLQNADPIATC